jgi:hypothetical protein
METDLRKTCHFRGLHGAMNLTLKADAQPLSIRYVSGLRNQISLPFNHSCKTCNPNSYALESQDSTYTL